jgi:predicted regulator of Ras-like GTPase activity (Roadblock/LC7/MglB family)
MYENVIADLMSIDGIRFVVLADNEGNVVEFESPHLGSKEIESLTAFFTDFFNKGSVVIAKASDGEVVSILVECKNEKILIGRVDRNLVLILGAEPRTNIGLMRIESKKAIEKIQMMG